MKIIADDRRSQKDHRRSGSETMLATKEIIVLL
jgi:hypothetical protein